MSDTTEYVTPEVDPTVGGQVENVGEDTSFEMEEDYFQWDEFADKKVKLPVAGEEVEIPLKEALAGYQRQADYTRKTQELSQQRQQVQFAAALQEALDKDPAATLELLTKHYGLDSVQESEDEFLDPSERQLRQLEKRIASFEEQQALQEIERTVGRLQARYGEDFDANEVVARALALGSNDLEAVYKQIAFDRLWENQVNQKNSVAQKEQQIVEQKRQTGIIAGGASSAASAETGTGQVSSLRDAFAMAKRQLGIS